MPKFREFKKKKTTMVACGASFDVMQLRFSFLSVDGNIFELKIIINILISLIAVAN